MSRPGLAVLVAGLVGVLGVACTRSRGGAGSSSPTAAAQVTGRLAPTGSEPAVEVTLLADSGGPVRVVGALSAELRALVGATVVLWGEWSAAGPGPGIDVASYEVLSIDGQRPSVGILMTRGGALWLAGGDTVRLIGPPTELRTRLGAKVWVVGPGVQDAIEVQSYGVIRDNTGR